MKTKMNLWNMETDFLLNIKLQNEHKINLITDNNLMFMKITFYNTKYEDLKPIASITKILKRIINSWYY